jgi:hypothetical protein
MNHANAHTNALPTMTNAPTDTHANAHTNATDAMHTRPPIPPSVLTRAFCPATHTAALRSARVHSLR